jgi:D-alanyl-D-alanine carboxypeptidase
MKVGKKYIAIALMISFILVNGVPLQGISAKTKAPGVNAYSYVVMDANSGEVLFSENRDKQIYPASTIKLMTAVVAMDNAELPDKIISPGFIGCSHINE